MLSKFSKILILKVLCILGLAGILGFKYYQSSQVEVENECTKLKKQINTLLEKADYCLEDSDCIVYPARRPCLAFGCYQIVNKNSLTKMRI